jgi:hypothetical protein
VGQDIQGGDVLLAVPAELRKKLDDGRLDVELPTLF